MITLSYVKFHAQRWIRLFVFAEFCLGIAAFSYNRNVDAPCHWRSLNGAEFNLQPLTLDESEESYFIEDGDIPCTVGVEPTYSYVWNICGSITAPSFPPVCGGVISKSASAVQFLNRSTDGYNECEMIGEYNGVQDDASYSLLDISNPAKGVSITYTLGDRCGYHKDLYRSATIDIYCSDVEVEIQSAEEPSLCQYHFVMKSYYGCPLSCPITREGGLCNSHGHCAYDSAIKKARCFCNEGYNHGNSCLIEEGNEMSSAYDYDNSLVVLLVALLVVTCLLVLFVCVFARKIMQYRMQEKIKHSVPGTISRNSG